MPIYDYECLSCGSRFERRQGFHEEPVALCPHCQGRSRRLLHSVPVIFKGSGFYVTDNRRGNSSGYSTRSETPPEKTPEKTPEKSQKEESPSLATAKED